MKDTILFVTHKPKQCGVYEFGNNVFNAIASSDRYQFTRVEADSKNEVDQAVSKYNPKAIIYNYHPSVMPWLCTKVVKGVYKNNIADYSPINIGIIHEITQEIADSATGYRNKIVFGTSKKKLNSLFDFYIAADPTLLLKNPLVFKTGRLVPEYKNLLDNNNKDLVIGSFGFATPQKGFEKVVEKVQEEFDNATIRFNIPAADFGDKNGMNAKQIVSECQSLIKKPGIKLEISHQYFNQEQLLDFLAGNSLNMFMYEDTNGRGISSAVDMAMAVKKPIAISRCPMFRHLLDTTPSVCVTDISLHEILANGFTPLERKLNEWNRENLQWEYNRIMDRILSFQNQSEIAVGFKKRIGNIIRKTLTLPDKQFTWLRSTSNATEDDMSAIQTSYQPVTLEPHVQFNKILDDEARRLYQPTINKLTELVPKTMQKKIARANVQQAFIFDTVYRFIKQYDNPKILCVGSYEDTASMALICMGYPVEEIDPMINYYLQEFYTKPSTLKNAYQIIFSTSVIEHDPNDESFMKCIAGLLAPGGTAILTCDFKEGWKPGQPKPEVDARFYTKADLEQRLLSYIPDCELLDTPNWDCPNPDFNYLGKYQYTFATFSIRKALK